MRPTDYLLLGLIIAIATTYNTFKSWRRRTLKAKLDSLSRLEHQALKLLAEQGYRLVGVRYQLPITITMDGREYTRLVRADLVVKKDKETLVVVLKKGGREAKRGLETVRRRILEYYLVYRPDGIVMLDVSSGRSRRFSLAVKPKAVTRRRQVVGYVTAALVGFLAGWLALGMF